jgi:hypothetical protein
MISKVFKDWMGINRLHLTSPKDHAKIMSMVDASCNVVCNLIHSLKVFQLCHFLDICFLCIYFDYALSCLS